MNDEKAENEIVDADDGANNENAPSERSDGYGNYCCECGDELCDGNSHAVPENFNRFYGCSHYCTDCEQRYFDKLASAVSSYTLALFYCCIMFNVVFDIELLPAFDKAGEHWKDYLIKVNNAGANNIDGEIAGFFDGTTDIRTLFKPTTNTAAAVSEKAPDTNAFARMGVQRQKEEWGEIDCYTHKDFAELDRMYSAYSADYSMLTSKQKYILHEVVKLYYASDCARRDNKITDAQRLTKMADERLASEQMRKKDEKPIEQVRIDAVTSALEKAGYMKNKKLLSYDELVNVLRGSIPRYKYTKDSADQAILLILNTMAKNDGKPELSTLPDNMRVDGKRGEFAENPSDKEKKIYNQLGLLRMPPKNQGEK